MRNNNQKPHTSHYANCKITRKRISNKCPILYFAFTTNQSHFVFTEIQLMMQDGIIDSFLTVGVGGSLSSTVHQIGFVVLIHISSLASQFDVEIAPSNPDSFSAGFVIS